MKELAKMHVVDGQQRLTTLTLLIGALVKALRETGRETDKQLATELTANFLITRTEGGFPLLRLNPQETTDDDGTSPVRDYYAALLRGARDAPADEIRIPAVKRMQAAALLFDNYVAQQKQAGLLKQLLQQIQARLLFGLNEEKSLHHASDIFEGLNNRGKPLTDLERVKSHAAYVTGAALQTGATLDIPNHGEFHRESAIRHMNALIGDIYRTLDAVGMPTAKTEQDLIEAHWPSIEATLSEHDVGYQRPDGGDDTPFEQASDRLSRATNLTAARKSKRETSLVAASMDYVASLQAASIFYTDLMRPAGEDAFATWRDVAAYDDIKRLSISLQSRMQASKRFAPLLIAARLAAPDDPDSYLTLLRHVETAVFWGNLVFGSSILGERVVNKLAGGLAAKELSVEGVCNQIAKNLRKGRCKNHLDDIAKGDQIEKRITRNFIKVDNQASGIIIGEYWHSNFPEIIKNIGTVHSAVKNDHYFNRVYTPRQGRPKQAGLGDVDVETRVRWQEHVSNIIPALGARQQRLAEEKDGDVTDTVLLIEAGVARELIRDPLTPETVEGLIDSVCDFVAERWPLDDFVSVLTIGLVESD